MKVNKPLYRITRKFTGGTLKGITITQNSSVKMEVGFKCEKPVGGSPYVIVAVEKIN